MAGDALDDLLDYDGNENDVFRDIDINMDLQSRSKESFGLENNQSTRGLGIDEEIQIKERRRPVAKLDQHR